MRLKVFLFIIALLSILAVHAQRLDTLPIGSQQLYSKYMKRSSTYKTIGWVLLGTGVVMFGTTYLVNVENGWNGATQGEDLFGVGIAVAALSTPFFILAGASKRKAKLVLKGERLTSAILSQRLYYPAVSLKINL